MKVGTVEPEPPIELVAYDPTWPAKFAGEREILALALGRWLVGPIEHIGSTAVPGLAAKPIVDIMAPVATLSDSRPAIEAAAGLGYIFYPYKPDVMHWFCKPSRHLRTHHLHMVPLGSELWKARIAFRDALRSDALLLAEYQSLKLQLVERFSRDRDAYTEAKGPFIQRVLHEASKRGPGAT